MNELLSIQVREVLRNHGVLDTDTLIVAVSGGADSMVLLHCCAQLKMQCVAAHVNYGLRGTESDEDEKAVLQFCHQLSIPCETLHVEEAHWQQHSGSTQEAARSIRYTWFDSLRDLRGARCILTAHHANDQTETMLLQFIRGGAGKSVYGMALQRNALLRPLLGITRAAILRYAEEHSIAWRNDSSNDSDSYTRNFIRHHLVPLVEKLNPEIHAGALERSVWMHEEQRLADRAAHDFFARYMARHTHHEELSIPLLMKTDCVRVLIWKWLSNHGFTSGQTTQIAQVVLAGPRNEAATFSSPTHDIHVQYDSIVCAKKEHPTAFTIEGFPFERSDMRIDLCSPSDVYFAQDSQRQYLDAALLTLPLLVRPWKAGDRFFPLGSSGEQKVSDYLTHAKVPAWRKEKILVLETNQHIAAVVGFRISEKFKVCGSTQQCLRIAYSQ
jgi:tRNA(Ile)-lysidine synthase